ncbi:neutral/alkaline non-lysosomal ceramidase N-terminal domain-containing protein [Candidatus Sumerlaeota bacterium]|nr:neutral/alkaline non-lysosomal ceramidase N-terminal domain-containing protein [Candidatus Sumerlaeota bacterium]
MRKSLFLIVAILVSWRGNNLSGAQPSEQAAQWQVGYAETDTTPRPGQVMMAGYGRERHAEGTIAPLRAQALALQDRSGKTALLITADVLGFDRGSVDAVRYKIQQAHHIPPEAVCLSASHTHWGPAINYRMNFALGGLNVWYLASLESALLKVADGALKDLSPAAINYGACEAQIGVNRRLKNKNGQFTMSPNPEGGYDKHTPVLRIVRQRSPKQIVLAGHACHPTSTGNVDKWSSEYPGTMRQKLETTLEDCRAMFVMGCGGDAKVVWRDEKTGRSVFAASPEQSQAGGIRLADAALAFLKKDALSALDAELHTSLVSGELSFRPPRSRAEIEKMALGGNVGASNTWWARQSLAYPDDRRTQYYEVQAWRLGELTIVALEGEVCSDWGGITRAMAKTKHAMVIAYANNCPGYIPTARIIREGGYEGDTSHMAYFLPAPFDPRMETELRRLVEKAIGR